MSDKDLIQKLTGSSSLKDSIFFHEKRLEVIQNALNLMKLINQQFLKSYQLTETWNKVNGGLMRHNIQVSLQNIVQFKICQSNKPERTYFNPFSKRPITICYNKFMKKQLFNKHLDFNMILYYDSKTKKKMNWNNLQDTVKANVRAINLSGICRKDDLQCIKNQLQARVFDKQRFKGIQLKNLAQVVIQGLEDTSPISQIVFRDS